MRPNMAAVVEELSRCSPADVAALLDELRRMRAALDSGEGGATLGLVRDEGAT